MKEKTKKLILPGVALLLAILFGILMPTQLVAADAATKNRETAEGKGFTIEGFTFCDDYTVEFVPVGDGGNMSFWVAFYSRYSEATHSSYVTFLIEARLATDNLAEHYNSKNMNITIRHENYLDTKVLTYSPTQTSTQYTVNESFDIGLSAGTSGVDANIGYSYQTSQTYSDISYTYYAEYEPIGDTDFSATVAEFNYNFRRYATNTEYVAPYGGETIQKLAITFQLDHNSYPGYDTDGEEYEITYTGEIYQPRNYQTDSRTISVKFRSGMVV